MIEDNRYILERSLKQAERQISVNEADIRYLETVIRDILSDNEHMIRILDEGNEKEAILGYLLQYRCRHDLISRCAGLIHDGRYPVHDLLRIFGHSIYAEAADLLDQAYASRKNSTETGQFTCPDPDECVLVQDPEVHRLFGEYERFMQYLDGKVEEQEIQRFLVRERYRNELVCLCVKYILIEDLPVSDLKGMFGPEICTEAFILQQDLRERWITEKQEHRQYNAS